MRVKSLFILLFFFSSILLSQNNQWVWIKGGNTINQPGIYGTKGVPAMVNTPGARYEPCEWTDQQGNFWLYGGHGYWLPNVNGYLNDLWKYNPTTNQWTWIHGSNNAGQPAVYGTKGIPAAANTPGGRGFGAATWIDNAGNLWLYGGSAMNGVRDDMWKFDISLGQWAWMHGSGLNWTLPTYGTKGVAAATNSPGARNETSCTWVDNNGNFWLFGGTTGSSNFNDLWKFNPSTNQWTWVSGSNTTNQGPVYGTRGVASASNIPGARMVYASWITNNDNDLWLFGGKALIFPTSVTASETNDLWKYNIANDTWTWVMGGPNSITSYGSQCTPAATNIPPSRMENRVRWKDDCDNLWMFGGGGDSYNPTYNDLWKFNTTTNIWTWINGGNTANQAGVYGTISVPAPGNKPPSKLGAVGWRNEEGLWLFGGAVTGGHTVNDLWKYIPSKPIPDFIFSGAGCAPSTVTFTDQSNPNCDEIRSYTWNFGDPGAGATNFSTLQNPSHLYSTAGTYSVKLIISNCFGQKDSITKTVTINICGCANPPVASASNINHTTCGNNNGSITVSITSGGMGPFSYVWSAPVGATSSSVSGLSPGTYSVVVADNNGCKDTVMNISINSSTTPTLQNPTLSMVSCHGDSDGGAGISAAGGLPPYQYTWSPAVSTTSSATALAAGIYSVTVTDMANCIITTSLSITQPSALSATITAIDAHCGNNNGSATINVTGGSSPYTFSWNNGTSSSSISGLATGTYSCMVTDSKGCTTTIASQVNNPGNFSLALFSSSTAICYGQSVFLTASIAGGTPPFAYSWSSSQTSPTISVTPVSSSIFTCSVTDSNGCSASDSLTITVNQLPQFSFDANDTSGCAPLCIDFLATPNQSFQSYTWNFGDGNPKHFATNTAAHCYTHPGTYAVELTVSDINNCSKTISRNNYIRAFPKPIASFQTNPSVTSVLNSGIQFIDNSILATHWNWNFGDISNPSSTIKNPYFVYSDTGTYQVTLIVNTDDGCADTVISTISILPELALYIPDAFTPDADGLNDVFTIKGLGIDLENFELYIFDRWGDLIFSSRDINKGWNGKANNGNEVAQIDVYVWKIHLIDITGKRHELTGKVTLIK